MGGHVTAEGPGFFARRVNLFGSNKQLAALCRPYLWSAGVVGLFATATGLLEGIGVSLLIPLISTFGLSYGTRKSSRAVALLERFGEHYSPTHRLFLVASVILGLVVLKCILQAVGSAFAVWINGRVAKDIGCALARRLHFTSYSFFLEHDSSRLLNILTTEWSKSAESIIVVLLQVATAATVMVFGALLFLVSWRLTLMVLVGGVLARVIQTRFEWRLRAVGTRTVASSEVLSSKILVAVFGARVIRLFHTQKQEQVQFEAAADSLRRDLQRSEWLMGTRGPALEAARTALLIIVLLTAILNGVSIPVLAAFLALVNRLQPHLQVLEQSSAKFASAAAHFGEVEWLLKTATDPAQPAGHLPLKPFESIRFEKVKFQYPNRNESAIDEVSFVLHPGRPTALTGASGCGKSTIVNLLMRLLEPSGGVIKVGDTQLSEIKLVEWLGACGIAGQDIDLVDGTIAENIAYGTAAMDRSLIEDAVRSAGADFVFDLPAGLETRVGTTGAGPLRRSASTHRHCPRAGQEAAIPDPGRSDQCHRRRDRRHHRGRFEESSEGDDRPGRQPQAHNPGLL